MGFIQDDEILRAFKEESREHLDGIESDLLAIEEAGADIDAELVNKVFRAMHSIKGGASFLGLQAVKKLAHAAEDLLNKIRNRLLVPTASVISSLLEAADLINRLLNQPKGAVELEISETLAALHRILSPAAEPEVAAGPAAPPAAGPSPPGPAVPWHGLLESHGAEIANSRLSGETIFILEYDVTPEAASEGLPPAAIADTLGSIGQVLGVLRVDDRQPSYVLFATMMDKDMLVSFSGLPLDRAHEIREPGTATGPAAAPSADQPPMPPPVAEIAPPPAPAPASASQKPAAAGGEPAKAGGDGSLRVNVKILDNLMTLAGELVLTRNQFLQIVHSSERRDFDAVSQRLDLVTSELQGAIMSTRMQPVGNVFNKFKRVVRDLAQKMGKEIELLIEGGEVEMDKTIIEALADPLTHLVRNSVDHGIETPDKRAAAGKPPTGTLALKAFHEGGQVIIEVVDDGAGIDTARIKEKVLGMGTHDRSQIEAMSEPELLKLIFLPGLSTAREVTEVSGRGVGMDVVNANLSKVGGAFDIASTIGKGTTITIKLPLTLAIIPSLIVSVASERYAIPQVNMVELVRVPAVKVKERIERIGEALVIRLRGKLLPIVSLSEALGIETRNFFDPVNQQTRICRRQRIEDRRGLAASRLLADEGAAEDFGAEKGPGGDEQENRLRAERRVSPLSAVNILVVSVGKFHYGLIVDKLLDSEEIVVKPLGSHLRQCQVYAGATIQGDGRVALILDVVGISKVMNLSAVSEQVRSREQPEVELLNRDAQTFLLVRNSLREQLAIPLNLVSRIEKIRPHQVELVGGRRNMQYRDAILPLFSLEEAANVAPPRQDAPHLYVVVFPCGQREMGIVVSEIVDISTVTVAIDDTTHRQPGIMGSAIIQQRITLLIDLFGLVGKVVPEWIQHTKSGRSQGRAPRNILVVEDAPFFSRQICGFVADMGYRAFSATDGVEGLKVLEQEKIDLVLTDIEMPNMDGLEFTTRVRSEARWAGLPIIAVTSLSGEAAEKRGLKAGVNEYMIKLDREKIIAAINRYLKN